MSECCRANFVKEYKPDGDARVELKNGRFLDVVNGRYLQPGASVIIRGGKIESISGVPGEAGNVTPDFTVDLQGKAVLPGLFNTHCHTSLTIPSQLVGLHDIRLNKRCHDKQMAKNMAECLAHGVTNIRDAWTSDLRHTRKWKQKIASGETPGPRIWQSVAVGPFGGYLSENFGFGVRLLRSLAGWPVIDYERPESGVVAFPVDASDQQVRDAVDRAVDERGADFIKIGEQRENMINLKPDASIMSINQLKALTDQARRRGLKSTMHHVSVESFRRGVESGVWSLAHAPFDAGLKQADIDAFKAAGCIIEPTATVAYDVCWKIKGDPLYEHPEMERLSHFRDRTYAALMDEYWIPELRNSVNKAYARITAGRVKSFGIIDVSKIFKYYSGVVSHGTGNIKLLFEQGARMGLGNDGGVPPCTPAMMGHEISMLDSVMNRDPDHAMLDSAEAIRIATINSACALGLEDRFGTIETGKMADLVVLNDDPLEDMQIVGTRVAALFMDGRLVIDNCGLEVESVQKAGP